MKRNLLSVICVAVLCVMLSLGLWPFHAPANQVTWLADRDGLRLGRYATIISSGSFQMPTPRDNPEASLEIWLQPNRLWDSRTVLAFYKPENPFQFSIRQSQTDVLIRVPFNHATMADFLVNNVFHRDLEPVFLTITTGPQGTHIYINGIHAAVSPRFPLSANDFTGRLVLGDSPRQSDSWSGRLLGLAMYHRQLPSTEVLGNYLSWKQTGRPEIAEDEDNIAMYLFDERTGDVVRDKARSGVDLYIPATYEVLDKFVLEPFWTEFNTTRAYRDAAFKNVVGFVPFGFIFCAYWATRLPEKRAALVTVAIGLAVSLTIEALQAFLPTRDSGTTDLITNTLGTWFGAALYRTPLLARFLRWSRAQHASVMSHKFVE